MPRITSGRKVRCDTVGCVHFEHVWTLKPVLYREPGHLVSELHIWPDVLCSGCGSKPVFIGYTEEEVPK